MYSPHCAARWAGLSAAALILAIAIPAPAVARQDTGTLQGTVQVTAIHHCALTRIGTQFVRCDSLTGAGAPAASWVPES